MRYLIIGGLGSIGSALSEELSKSNDITIMDINESLVGALPNNIKFILGDATRIEEYPIHSKFDVIIYLAAMKCINVGNTNPLPFLRVNCYGNEIAMQYADRSLSEDGTYFYMSTDKATSPSSVLGVTKLLGEQLVCSYGRKDITRRYISLRLGNVLISKGSVVEYWVKMIKAKRESLPVRMATRFFLSTPSVVKSICDLIEKKEYISGVYIDRMMKSLYIPNLAEIIVNSLSPNTKIEIEDLTPGEKEHEELLSPFEMQIASYSNNYCTFDHTNLKIKKERIVLSDSGHSEMYTKEEIKTLLYCENRFLNLL